MGPFDISRINVNAKKHYEGGVRMQQGRALVEEDWNENEWIKNEKERLANVDIIGPYGSPDNGFSISPIAGSLDFNIDVGKIYLGGLRFEMDQVEKYSKQSDWLSLKLDEVTPPLPGDPARFDLVYLEAWQQPVCAVEDSSLFEEALGGPDTSTRVKHMRRVHIAPNVGSCNCGNVWENFQTNIPKGILKGYELFTDALLKVAFLDTGLPEDPCIPSVTGGYLGAENQAIRVQIRNGNKFTWGFDNASPYYRVQIAADGKTVTLLTDPKDQYHWPLAGQVVEILPFSAVLPNNELIAEQSGHLTKVITSYDPDSKEFSLRDALPAPAPYGANHFQNKPLYYMRVWNRGSDLASEPELSLDVNSKLVLGNTGIECTISGLKLIPDDYWVIGARPDAYHEIVPWELLSTGIAPHGVKRFYAPLAIIRWSNEGQALVGELKSDCRKKFHPLTEQECCCTYTVGDGVNSRGDFNSIQDAVNSLPAAGGKICVLKGVHNTNLRIHEKKQVRITGCGDQSIVQLGDKDNVVIKISNSHRIQIDQLTIFAPGGTGIEVADVKESKMISEHITICDNRIVAMVHAVNVRLFADKGGSDAIFIINNQIGMIDNEKGDVAIFSLADDVLIEKNRIVVVPDVDKKNPEEPRNPDGPGGDLSDPCDPGKVLRKGYQVNSLLYWITRYILLYKPSGSYKKPYAAPGGIQIGSTSERVRILRNEIIGGSGNGIILGHLKGKSELKYKDEEYSYSALYDISIEENQILMMGLSGISDIQGFQKNERHLSVLEDITIYRNRILHCANQLPQRTIKSHSMMSANASLSRAVGGIIMGMVQTANILENRIENNGNEPGDPICGIFILNGDNINISNNVILENGISGVGFGENDPGDRPGLRAGIMVRFSFKASKLNFSRYLSSDGVPAVKVHDNVVVQPVGHALFILAFGPVSVVSNQFVSRDTVEKEIFSLLASAILILDLGFSKDLMILSFIKLAHKNPAYDMKNRLKSENLKMMQLMQLLPDGKVMFAGNQTTLDMRSDSNNFALSSQLIASLDDVGYNTNQSECAAFLSIDNGNISIDSVLWNTTLIGFSVRANDNRFSDGFTINMSYSLFSYGFMNTAVGNQSTHCLHVLGGKTAESQNIVLYDDKCKDRKLEFDIALNTPLYTK